MWQCRGFSQYVGVSWLKNRSKWEARIKNPAINNKVRSVLHLVRSQGHHGGGAPYH